MVNESYVRCSKFDSVTRQPEGIGYRAKKSYFD